MAHDRKLYLYETETCSQSGEAEQEGLDVFFPPHVDGWPDVLDCRIPPYTERSLEENCEYASHVRKYYILVTEAQVKKSTPPTEATED